MRQLFSPSLQIRRGVRVLLDNATATINPGRKSAWWVKRLPLLALLKKMKSHRRRRQLHLSGSWQLALGGSGNMALPQAALEYVIDGDREYRSKLEAQLHDANRRDDERHCDHS